MKDKNGVRWVRCIEDVNRTKGRQEEYMVIVQIGLLLEVLK